MRSDLLSKRLFYAGCFGLPWLWAVHVLFHWKNASSLSENVTDDEALLNPDDHFADDNDESGLTPEQIQIEAQKWVSRCKKGAIVSLIVFIAWNIVAQLLRKSGVFPPSLFMLNPDDVAITGW